MSKGILIELEVPFDQWQSWIDLVPITSDTLHVEIEGVLEEPDENKFREAGIPQFQDGRITLQQDENDDWAVKFPFIWQGPGNLKLKSTVIKGPIHDLSGKAYREDSSGQSTYLGTFLEE